MHGDSGWLNDDPQIPVFKYGLELRWIGSFTLEFSGVFLERYVQMNAVAGVDYVFGLGSLAVEPYAVFAKELAHIPDWEAVLEKIFNLLKGFRGWNENFLDHICQLTISAGSGQEPGWAIFAIL